MNKFLFIPFLFISSLGHALSQGPNFPASCVNDASFGTSPWDTPSNAQAEDGIVSTTTLTISQYLGCTQYGFILPNTAIVTGIVLEAKKGSLANRLVIDNSVKLYQASIVSGTEHGDFTHDWIQGSVAWSIYGSSTDTWGLSLTGADINNSGWGSVLGEAKDSGGSQTGNIDAFRMTIYYALAPLSTTINNGVIKSGSIR